MGKKEIRKPWSEKAGHGKIRHGEHSTRLHHIWRSFRLGRKKYRIYPDWEIYINFRNWALEAGYIPEKMMLRRKNKYLGYSPKNCYWLPRRKPISAFGETKKLEEWIRDKRCVLKYHEQLSRRLRRGMDPELALTYIRKHRPERRGRKKIKGLRRVWKEIEYDSFGWENFREFEWWLKQNGYKPGFRVVRKDHWKQWSPKNCMAVHRSEAFFYGLAVGGWDLHLFRAWGESKTITEWLEDRRCRCNCREILEERFRKKWRIEWAISLHPFWKREIIATIN